jgi:hypothetical protein
VGDYIFEVRYPDTPGSSLGEELDDLAGDLEDYGGGTWLGSSPWMRDQEWLVPDELNIDLDKLEADVNALYDKHFADRKDLREMCEVSYYEDEEDDEPDLDEEPPDMSGPGNPSGDGR